MEILVGVDEKKPESTMIPPGEHEMLRNPAPVHVPKVEPETRQETRDRIVREMDERDEEQILADLAGLPLRYVQRFVYAYCPSHKDAAEDPKTGWPTCGCPSSEWIVEITYNGIKEASNREAVAAIVESVNIKRGKLLNVREYAEIETPKGPGVKTVRNEFTVNEAFLDVPDYVEAHAYARRWTETGVIVRQGFAREPLEKRSRKGEKYPNEFPELKAIGKATRNAQKQLISQILVRDWIDSFLGISTGAANDQGLGTDKKVGAKTRIGKLLAAKYADDTEAARKAFQFVTAKKFFPNEEPGSKFYTSFQQLSEAEANALLSDLELGKIKLPERETLFPEPQEND